MGAGAAPGKVVLRSRRGFLVVAVQLLEGWLWTLWQLAEAESDVPFFFCEYSCPLPAFQPPKRHARKARQRKPLSRFCAWKTTANGRLRILAAPTTTSTILR